MARKLIRPGDWENLRRTAKEALDPDPPEPINRPEPLATPYLRSRIGPPSKTPVAKTDPRLFSPQGQLSAPAAVTTENHAQSLDEAERRQFTENLISAGWKRSDAEARLVEVTNSPIFCCHANEMPHVCECASFCYCRVHGNCDPKFGEMPFVMTAKLVRQWNKEMFEQPTNDVAYRLATDKNLAYEVVNWARQQHGAWSSKHGRELVMLALHHKFVRNASRNRPPVSDKPETRSVLAMCQWCQRYPGDRTLVGMYDDLGVVVYRCPLCNNFENFYTS